MNNNHQNQIALILARAGSKRIPNKNAKPFNGTTITNLTIEAALKLNLKTIISSDSLEILDKAPKGSIKHLRSNSNSDDFASSENAILEVIEFFNLSIYNEIILLQPTSPLRDSKVLMDFLIKWEMYRKEFDQAISVTEFSKILWNVGIDGKAQDLFNRFTGIKTSRKSTERTKYFEENGAIYLSKISTLVETQSLVGGKLKLIEIPKLASIDIDTIEDFELAEKIHSSIYEKK